jgi:drug/metabolite transporter (DMT)-like permease
MVVVVLALVSAALSAVSAAGQHRAASGVARVRGAGGTAARTGAAGFALALVTSPLWLGSWGLDVGAFLAQAGALHLGALSVVQPLMVTTLLCTLPLAALGRGRRPSAGDWAGAIVLSAGLALVLSARGSVGEGRTAPGAGLVVVLAGLVALVVLLVVVARGRSASVRAAVLGVAAGALFGVGAALTKLTAGVAGSQGLVGLLTSWPGYALAVASVASIVLQQSAYAAGPLATVMTAVVITDPLTSYLLGVVGFGEPLPGPGAPLAVTALGMLALALGVARLARSPLLQPVPPAVPAQAAAVPAEPARVVPELVAVRRSREPCVVAGCAE